MYSSFDPGALLASSYVLPRGPRVRLRLARSRDLPAIRALLEQQGLDPVELGLARLVRFDPRWIVICATALIGSAETVVGIGAIELGPDASVVPDTLIVDEHATEGLAELLSAAL